MSTNAKKGEAPGEKLVCRNPKATFRYEIEDRLEAGMVLTGSEVKSLRAGRGDLEAAFARIENGELFLSNFYIAPYEGATAFGHDPRRTRKLLLHGREIDKWHDRVTIKGYTIVPMRVYLKKGLFKVELGIGKGKKSGDDREKVKREADLKDARAAISASKAKGLRK